MNGCACEGDEMTEENQAIELGLEEHVAGLKGLQDDRTSEREGTEIWIGLTNLQKWKED